MSTPAGDLKEGGDAEAPREWKQAAPNDSFSYYSNQKTTIIPQTIDTFILDQTKSFGTPQLYIYAETIKITGNVTFPGKELGLFCNKLILEYTINQKSITVSVSGAKGDDGVPNNKSVDSNGKPGGKIILYVEDPDDDIFPTLENTGLFLRAAGGGGGHRATNIATGDIHGGSGGNGGNGGSINVYFGHPLTELRCKINALMADKSTAWTCKTKLLSETDFKDERINSELKDRRKQNDAYIAVINNMKEKITYMPFDSAPAEIKEDEGGKVIVSIENHLRSATQPSMPDSANTTIENCHKAVEAIRTTEDDDVPQHLWKAYEEATSALSTILNEAVDKPMEPGEGDIAHLIQKGCDSLDMIVTYYSDNMRLMFPCDAGKGWLGGRGAVSDQDRGKDGSPGKNGSLNIRQIDFSDSISNLTIPDPIISPDQCQMMLNQIDMMYFRASGGVTVPTLRGKSGHETSKPEVPSIEAYKSVKSFYERVERRLNLTAGFRDQMVDRADLDKLDKTQWTKYALLFSFVKMQHDGLTLDPLSSLSQMRMHVFARLNWPRNRQRFHGSPRPLGPAPRLQLLQQAAWGTHSGSF